MISTSRTSSFFYKGRNKPIAEIGTELNVSTILEGSVRLAGKQMRITAQLIDVYNRCGSSTVILEEVELEKVSRYGVLKGKSLGDGLYQVEDLVEKPTPEEAPSNLAFAGRYVFTPEIFSFLQKFCIFLAFC